MLGISAASFETALYEDDPVLAKPYSGVLQQYGICNQGPVQSGNQQAGIRFLAVSNLQAPWGSKCRTDAL